MSGCWGAAAQGVITSRIAVQAAKVERAANTESLPVILFVPIGEPECAELAVQTGIVISTGRMWRRIDVD